MIIHASLDSTDKGKILLLKEIPNIAMAAAGIILSTVGLEFYLLVAIVQIATEVINYE